MHNLSEIRAKFATLHETKDLVLLKSIFSDLTVKKVGRQVTNINPRDIPVDLFIECAESALQVRISQPA